MGRTGGCTRCWSSVGTDDRASGSSCCQDRGMEGAWGIFHPVPGSFYVSTSLARDQHWASGGDSLPAAGRCLRSVRARACICCWPLVVTWTILPGWPFQWLSIAGKAQVACVNPTLWGLAYEWWGQQLWPASAIGAGGTLYLGLLLFFCKQRREDWLFSLGLAVAASIFLAPYLWNYEQTVLLFPTIIALYWGLRSKRGPRWVWWAGWWFTTAVLSWVLLFFAHRRGVDTWSAFLPLAALGYLLLAWQARRVGLTSAAVVEGE